MVEALKQAGSSFAEGWRKRTGKRESGLVMLVLVIIVTLRVFIWLPDIEVLKVLLGFYAIIVPGALGYAGTVFGMDWYSKQQTAAAKKPEQE